MRDAIYAAAAATGVRRHSASTSITSSSGRAACRGSICFMRAPIGAPMALALAGLLGRGAERVRDTRRIGAPAMLRSPAGRTLARRDRSAGFAGTVGEAGLLHFRGAYHNPVMVLPVTRAAGRRVAARLRGAAPDRTTRSPDPLVAAPHGAARLCRRRLPRLRRLPQHGRLAQLEPERAQRAAAAGAAELHRAGARRPRGARRSSRKQARETRWLSAIPAMTCSTNATRHPGTTRRAR